MQVQATWNMALKVWWSFAWRSILISFLVALGLGIIGGIIKVIIERGFGVNATFVTTLMVLISFVIGLVVQIWVMKKVLNMKFSEFSVVTIESD